MMEEILSPADCAKCEFCCSFRRQSLNLTPYFAAENVDEICRLYPEARFKTLPGGAVTIDLDDKYQTDDSEEEALCPFNHTGCILPDNLKPFDCKLWPFRLMRGENGLLLALVPTCPWIKKDDPGKLKEVAMTMAKEAARYAKIHPELIIDYRADYQIILEVGAAEGEPLHG
ncbi:MAG: hypothetical protein J5367_03900 [Lachnospiraceae bacterium]|nr:hypothetical protein [Lachnospiraceae bacterium]